MSTRLRALAVGSPSRRPSGWSHSSRLPPVRNRAPTHAGATVRPPLRAIFYLTAPVRASALAGRPAPSVSRDDSAAVGRHLAALKWARADAAIVPWRPPGSAADRKLGAVLAAIVSTHAHVRAAALIDRSQGTELAQIRALAATRANAPGYLRIGARPAVFVAPSDRSQRTCTGARRWRAAAARFWLAQATFPGYGRLPQRGRRVVSRCTGLAVGERARDVPDPAGLLAERREGSDAEAIAGCMAELDRAHDRVGCPSPDHRFARRLVAFDGRRAERRLAIAERLRELSRCVARPALPSGAAGRRSERRHRRGLRRDRARGVGRRHRWRPEAPLRRGGSSSA